MAKNALIGIAFVVITIASLAWFVSLQYAGSKRTKQAKAQVVREEVVVENLTIESPEGVQEIGRKTMRTGATALDLLQATTTVELTGEGEQAFVTAIDGIQARESEQEFWAFYVNGAQATVGAGSYVLQNGDTITWKLETY